MGRAAEVVPVPADALDGLAAFERSGGLTRRDLLERGVGLWVGASAIAGLTTRGLLEAASAQAQSAPDATILVSLYLDGRQRRPQHARPAGRPALPRAAPAAWPSPPRRPCRCRASPQFGWHPAAEGLRRLYDQGKVAVLPSVDFADADQSHFNSVAYWRRGHRGAVLRDDRLARADPRRRGRAATTRCRASASRRRPTRCSSSRRARRRPRSTTRTASPSTSRGSGAPTASRAPTATPPRGRTGAGALAAARAPTRTPSACRSASRRCASTTTTPAAAAPVAYPDSDLGAGLKNLARMLGAGFGTRVAALSIGGFDTHDAQDAEHPDLPRLLDHERLDCLHDRTTITSQARD